jgi:hypothetical protein
MVLKFPSGSQLIVDTFCSGSSEDTSIILQSSISTNNNTKDNNCTKVDSDHKFYAVYNDSSDKATSRYWSMEEAEKAAKDLALAYPRIKFYVMESIGFAKSKADADYCEI